MTLEPIVIEYALRCDPARAFEVYTARIGEWWHPDYTANPKTLRAVTVEPRAGGRVFATNEDEEDVWGEVTAWEPGRRVAYTSTLAMPPEHPSLITVTFTPRAGGCAVRFEHGGWTEDNAHERRKFSEWRRILDRFAALADG